MERSAQEPSWTLRLLLDHRDPVDYSGRLREADRASLHQARVHVEDRLRSAHRRRQYHPQVSVQEAAAQDEAIALVDLDRIMTRIRATEAKLGLLSQGRQPPIG